MSYYGTFDRNAEQWFPDEDEPIRKCDSCGADLYEGQYAFDMYDDGVYCEDCFDKFLDYIRNERRISIGEET